MKNDYGLKKVVKVSLTGRFGSEQIITPEQASGLQGGGYYAYDSDGNVCYRSDFYDGYGHHEGDLYVYDNESMG